MVAQQTYVHKETIGNAVLYLGDCLPIMAQFDSSGIDVVVTDPPYGIGQDGGVFRDRVGGGHRVLPKKGWDQSTPDIKYFIQILRISKNQLIFGGNYFADKLPVSRGWLYWDKKMGGDFSDGELIYTSRDAVLRSISYCNKRGGKIHPTQKPVEVVTWGINHMHLDPNSLVIDPFMGSGTTGVVCHNLGHRFIGIEQDKDYFDMSCERIKAANKQSTIF